VAWNGQDRLKLPACFRHPISEARHEGPVLPEVGEGPSPRLQGRSSPWQGLRDLQVQPAFQGAPALSDAVRPRAAPSWLPVRGRRNATPARFRARENLAARPFL